MLTAACVALSGMSLTSQAARALIAPGLSSMQDVITSVEGEKVDVTVTTSGITMSGMGLTEYEDKMLASHLVYGDDNEVYIYEIFTDLPTQSYIKGVKDGDKVVVDLPQAVYYDDSMGMVEAYCYNLVAIDDFVDEYGVEWEAFVPHEKATLTFDIAEDGTMVAREIGGNLMLGAIDSEDGQWIGLGAWSISISSFSDEPVTVPDGLAVTPNFWTSVGDGYGWQVNFAQDIDEVYFQGLCERMPEVWIKGTVENEGTSAVVSIAQDQYVGDYMGYHIFTECVRMTVDDDGNIFYEDLMDRDYVYRLVWDFEKGTMVPEDKDVVLLFNTSKSEVYFINDLIDMKLIRQQSFDGIPRDPYGLKFDDVMQDEGFSLFSFNLPGMSTEGDYLVLDDLSYIVYVDEEEWPFDAEEYMLEESLVEIPWSFDGYGIFKSFESIEHKVVFFVEGITTLGVQTVYRHDGKETRSAIVSINVDDVVSVGGLDADRKVTDVKCFDVAGREISESASGLVIKRVTYDDGTVATVKAMSR